MNLKAQSVYTWSVVPQFTGTEIHRKWRPLLDLLEQHTKQIFKLKFYDSIPDFEKGFLKGESDCAYMDP